MDNPRKKPIRLNLVVVMVCVAAVSIAVSVKAPSYAKKIFERRQDECSKELQSFLAAEQAYFRVHGRYTIDLRKLNWHPTGKPRYLYGFRTQPEDTVTTTLQATKICPPESPNCFSTERMKSADGRALGRIDLPLTSFDAQGGFRFGCTGNVDTDLILDRYTIDEQGKHVHFSNDIQ